MKYVNVVMVRTRRCVHATFLLYMTIMTSKKNWNKINEKNKILVKNSPTHPTAEENHIWAAPLVHSNKKIELPIVAARKTENNNTNFIQRRHGPNRKCHQWQTFDVVSKLKNI